MASPCGTYVLVTDSKVPECERRVKEYCQIEWDESLIDDCRHIIRLAVREDLDRTFDLTTVALVPPDACGAARIVARQSGIAAGLRIPQLVWREMEINGIWEPEVDDGAVVVPGTCLGTIRGPARDLLTAERLVLNLMGRLSGVATQTRRYVDAVAGTAVRIYDTRKTTPGWRRLEKFAVRCGGGTNHRAGLFDGVLIKDNHLAVLAAATQSSALTPEQAVLRAREFLAEAFPKCSAETRPMIEVEVDTLQQLEQVLRADPDIVLLDNMTTTELRAAVAARDAAGSAAELEASGGITLANLREVAETGVERISVGALTHSAIVLDLGLDWI